MPSRVIRGDINSSRSLARVSRDARLTFRSLLNVVDDFGRFDGRISLLRSQLYPVDPDVTDKMVEGWLHELTLEVPTPPVLFYWVDGVKYLRLTGWEKHKGNQRRRKSSIYPDPPAGAETAGNRCPGSGGHLQEVTAGVGVGVGLGDGVGVEQAASPLPEPKPTDALQTAKSTFDPLPRYLEARESATAAKPTLWRAANQLGRKHYPGSKAEKLAWLYESEDVIVATAVGEVLKAGPMSEMAFNAKVLELMHRYYQHQFVERKPRPPRFESFEQAKRREGDDFWEKLKANGYRWAET